MCTLTFAWEVFEGTPLVVAANRDEAVDRPSSPPELVEGEPRVVAPRDEEAGGTWIGYNEYGLFAGIANRWTGSDREGERSRGLLLRDLLREPTAEDAVRTLERELDDRSYEGFNLVLADGFAGMDHTPDGFSPIPPDHDHPQAAILVEYDGLARTSVLEPGVHVVVNVGADGNYAVPPDREDAAREQAGNADRLLAALTPEPGESAVEWRDRAAEYVSDHEYGVCVHGDVSERSSDGTSASDGGFGTRSSSLLSFGEGGVYYRYADGPPCETEYEDVAASIR